MTASFLASRPDVKKLMDDIDVVEAEFAVDTDPCLQFISNAKRLLEDVIGLPAIASLNPKPVLVWPEYMAIDEDMKVKFEELLKVLPPPVSEITPLTPLDSDIEGKINRAVNGINFINTHRGDIDLVLKIKDETWIASNTISNAVKHLEEEVAGIAEKDAQHEEFSRIVNILKAKFPNLTMKAFLANALSSYSERKDLTAAFNDARDVAVAALGRARAQPHTSDNSGHLNQPDVLVNTPSSEQSLADIDADTKKFADGLDRVEAIFARDIDPFLQYLSDAKWLLENSLALPALAGLNPKPVILWPATPLGDDENVSTMLNNLSSILPPASSEIVTSISYGDLEGKINKTVNSVESILQEYTQFGLYTVVANKIKEADKELRLILPKSTSYLTQPNKEKCQALLTKSLYAERFWQDAGKKIVVDAFDSAREVVVDAINRSRALNRENALKLNTHIDLISSAFSRGVDPFFQLVVDCKKLFEDIVELPALASLNPKPVLVWRDFTVDRDITPLTVKWTDVLQYFPEPVASKITPATPLDSDLKEKIVAAAAAIIAQGVGAGYKEFTLTPTVTQAWEDGSKLVAAVGKVDSGSPLFGAVANFNLLDKRYKAARLFIENDYAWLWDIKSQFANARYLLLSAFDQAQQRATEPTEAPRGVRSRASAIGSSAISGIKKLKFW